MITERQEMTLIQPLIDNQTQIENIVVSSIVDRLKSMNTLVPSDVGKLESLYRSGSDVRKINKKIAQLTKKSEKQIKAIIKQVAQDSYVDAKPYYDYRKMPFIPFEKNTEVQKVIRAVEMVTLGEYERLSQASAFMLRDFANPKILIPTKLSKVYNKVIDNSIQSVLAGVSTYDEMIKNAIVELTDSGVKTVEYTTEKGKRHYQRLDSAVTRNILDGIKAVQQEVQNVTGEQFGADGVELSVHQYSAPDHEPVQGHQFSKEEFEKMQAGENCKDVKGKMYKGFNRPIGMWNCRHFAWNIIIGHKTPNYTDEQLEKIKEKNANGISVKDKSGKPAMKSMYWCTQQRNKYELKMKKLKEAEALAENGQQADLIQKYHSKLLSTQNEYKYFCKKCGLKTRFEKTKIFI